MGKGSTVFFLFVLVPALGAPANIARMNEVGKFYADQKRFMGSVLVAPGEEVSPRRSLENGQLTTQATGQPKIPIFAESEPGFSQK